jgi:signal transduction histidine kinase
MSNKSPVTNVREWALFGVKWLLIALFAVAIYLTRSQQGVLNPTDGLIFAVAVGAVINFVVALFLLVPFFHRLVQPVIAVGDVLIVGVFLQLQPGDPVLMIGIPAAVIASGLIALGWMWSAVQGIGVLLAVFVALVMNFGAPTATTLITDQLLVPALLLGGIVVASIIVDLVLDRHVDVQARLIEELREGETRALNNLRERTRAVYEMTTDFNTTLNYNKILNAALDIGRLGLRDSSNRGFSGAVLLFRPEDAGLYVSAGRRLTRADERVVARGRDGIIGQTLREAIPMFGKRAVDDPELQYFAGFQHTKSLLCIPLRAGYNNYGVLIYGSEVADAFDEDLSDLLMAIGTQVTIALQNAVLYTNLLQEKLRIVDVEEDARKKLARDLHDGPTQTVAAIAMRMSYITKLLQKKPEQVPEELAKVEELARRTTKEIRHLLFTLRPLVLETQGLTPALQQLAEKMMELHSQHVAVKVGYGVDEALDSHQQGALFYIVEEAVNNARKHAQAETITVSLGRQSDVVVCQISDNGVGFDLQAVDTNYERRGSLGMVNMRERAALLDGSLEIESAVGQGTIITVLVPTQDATGLPAGGSYRPFRLSPITPTNGVPY